MLTPITAAQFERARQEIENHPWFTDGQKDVWRRTNAQFHAEYEARYDAAYATLSAMDARARFVATDLLHHLGKVAAPSGSQEYVAILDTLAMTFDLTCANRIFEHDRDALVMQFGGRKARAA